MKQNNTRANRKKDKDKGILTGAIIAIIISINAVFIVTFVTIILCRKRKKLGGKNKDDNYNRSSVNIRNISTN